jgi:hypothetical protein
MAGAKQWHQLNPLGRVAALGGIAGAAVALGSLALWFAVGLSVDSAMSPPGIAWNHYHNRSAAPPNVLSLFSRLDALEIVLYLGAAIAGVALVLSVIDVSRAKPNTGNWMALAVTVGGSFAALFAAACLWSLKP